MVEQELADLIRCEIASRYPPKRGSLTRFCSATGFENSRLSEALNPDIDNKVSTFKAIADALGCDIRLVQRDEQ